MAKGYKVKSLALKVETGDTSGRSFLATWAFSKSHVSAYKVKFWYKAQTTKNGKKEYNWIGPSESEVKVKQATYSAPDNAIAVKVQVRPVSTKHKVKRGKKKVEVYYWTGAWCKVVTKSITTYGVDTPSAPTVSADDYNKITMSYKNLAAAVDKVKFQIVVNNTEQINTYDKRIKITKDNASKYFTGNELTATLVKILYTNVYKSVSTDLIFSVKNREVTFVYQGSDDCKYKVRAKVCNRVNGVDYWSGWSDYSDSVQTRPTAPTDFTSEITSATSAKLSWTIPNNAKKFTLQRAATMDELESQSGSTFTSTSIGDDTLTPSSYIVNDISGVLYFRISAVNSDGRISDWSNIITVTVGTKPSVPTTWSSVSTASIGENVNLYWVHNSEDGSKQQKANLELVTPGRTWSDLISQAKADDRLYSCVSGWTGSTSKFFKPYPDGTANSNYDPNTEIVLVTGETYIIKCRFLPGLADEYVRYICFSAPDDGRLNYFQWRISTNSTGTRNHELYIEYGENKSATLNPIELNTTDSTRFFEITNKKDEYGEWSDETSVYELDTSEYLDSDEILWRVQTMGATGEYGDWSIQRSVKVYSKPSLSINILDGQNGNPIDFESEESVTQFPVYVRCSTLPTTQRPISYSLSISAKEAYTTTDGVNVIYVNEGDEVYSGFFDANDNPLNVTLTVSDVDFENGITYTITGTVVLDSGLTATYTDDFMVNIEDESLEISGTVDYDADEHFATITAQCTEEDADTLASNVTLAVYRRTANGKFVLIQSDIANDGVTAIIDPHPTLDYTRYRIIATSTTTGAMTAYDITPEPTGETSIVIQWDEIWNSYDESDLDDDTPVHQSVGKVLLPYNISTTENTSIDITSANYIGRERTVTYYGTQLGESQSWTCEIPRDDEETLYLLRRLMVYPGNVYVRDPSGNGFWASVKVSFNRKYNSPVVSITLNVTPVEGGI